MENIKKLLREASEGSEDLDAKYKRIQRLLDNNIFNRSEIIDQLWGVGEKEDSSKRSLFSKKLNRSYFNGTKYEFNSDEINKISDILMNTSSNIRKNLGKKS